MATSDYSSILRTLRLPDEAVHGLYRSGSRVYGTARVDSDEDFVAVLAQPNARRDLVLGAGRDVLLHTRQSFAEAIARHSVMALECLFAPPEHRLKEQRPAPVFTLDRRKLFDSAVARSRSDFDKAARRFEEAPAASKKKLFHSLRVPIFALQIAERGRIFDFHAARSLWEQITSRGGEEWEPYRLAYGPMHEQLMAKLSLLTKRS
jgi:hypothetical protein